MSKSKIEWTDETWNPITGCIPISEGCQNCYAKRMANRLRGRYGYPEDEPFRVTYHRDKFDTPLFWKKPRRCFVCSMGDLFHKDVEWPVIDEVFNQTSTYRAHEFIVLTKRIEAAWYYFNSPIHNTSTSRKLFLTPNLWLGVTCENQQRADERIPILLQIPAAVRFVSCEPMLGAIDLDNYLMNNEGKYMNVLECGFHYLDWAICGGETGTGARPLHPDWARSLRDQCQDAGVPFFFKQWGEYCALSQMPYETYREWYVSHGTEGWDCNDPRWKVGKKAAGRILDGLTWDEFPEVAP